jgi:hypothetical protein
MNPNILILTAEEQQLLGKVPAAVTAGFDVQPEELETYETDEELEIRWQISALKDHPALRPLGAFYKDGKMSEGFSFDGVPPELIPEFCFTIGARGVTLLVAAMILDLKTKDDTALLSNLTQIRNQLLLNNQSISSSPSTAL